VDERTARHDNGPNDKGIGVHWRAGHWRRISCRGGIFMFTPSEQHSEKMKCESAGFWPLPINSGNEFAFLLKAPTSILKAAYRLCQLRLSVATARTPSGLVVGTVFSIFDDPTSPAMMSGIHCSQEEHVALVESLRLRRTIIVFFDELSHPVARAECALDPDACDRALVILGTPDERYLGPWTPLLAEVLDEVDGATNPVLATPPRYLPAVVDITLKLSEVEVNEIWVVGSHESRRFRLNDPNEGYGLEQATWYLVDHLFDGCVFHSPQVEEPGGTRELTDVLAFSEHGTCLFETKAAAMLTTSPERNTERRASSAGKQIFKGIDQILGAMRNVSRFLPLLTTTGHPIDMPHSSASPRHGVVLVSELLPSVDWTSIAQELIGASTPPAQLLHVLDLRELRLLVGASETPLILMTHLSRRFEIMKQCGSAFIRTAFDGPPPP
jgi:hypothetical protein